MNEKLRKANERAAALREVEKRCADTDAVTIFHLLRRNGRVTVRYLVGRTHWPIERITAALDCLQSESIARKSLGFWQLTARDTP